MYSLLAQFQSLFDASKNCTGTFSTMPGEPLCTFQDFINFMYRVVHFAVVVLAPLAVAVAIAYGSFLIMLYGANPDFYAKGKSAMYDAVLGLLIVWGAWAIVNTVFYLFGFSLPCGAAWYEIKTC